MHTSENLEKRIKGSSISRGIAIGRPFIYCLSEEKVVDGNISVEQVSREIHRFRQAIAQSRADVKKLQNQMESDHLSEGVDILDAHLQMIQDPEIHAHVEGRIGEEHVTAELALQEVMQEYQFRLDNVEDPFFRQRSNDLKDIARRITSYLRSAIRPSLAKIPAQSIVFAKDLSAPDVAEAVSSATKGFVTCTGGTTTHAAILARSKGIPYVGNIDVRLESISQEDFVIVDGRNGEVVINPTLSTLKYYQGLQEELNSHFLHLERNANMLPETFDGFPLRLMANVESGADVELMLRYGGNGVGLCRTENLFIFKDGFTSEEQQFQIYRSLIEQTKGLPIAIRVFDVGGDKFFFNEQLNTELNPFLGCRAIRFLLRHKPLFKIQLRAIYRASVYGMVSVLLPMVSEISELHEVKELIHDVIVELRAEGLDVREIPLGCMIEVPSAALISDLLARECDFFSIGTNDLVQYSLAVDRGSHTLNRMYAPTHPGVLRLIKLVIDEASRNHIEVSLCGEIASDPRFTPLLLGLGIRELSITPRYLPTIKNAIRNTSIIAAHELAEQALSLNNSYEILQLLIQVYKNTVPEDCYYNC